MKVGFIGLGTMGASMAANLQKAGHDLVVHDIRRAAAERHLAAGAVWADNPKALAEQVEVIFTSLPGPPEVEAVALGPNGLLAGMKPDTAYFDLSTNSPTVVRRINAKFAEKNVYMLDAIGDAARYIGPIGAGSVAKLVHNCAGYAIQTCLAEVFTMGVKAGVEPLALWEAVRQGAGGRRRTFDALGDHFLTDSYDPPDFALRLAHKDVTLATELARELKVPMPMANLAHGELTSALNRGWDGRDSRVAMNLQKERAGVTIKVDPAEIKAAIERDGK